MRKIETIFLDLEDCRGERTDILFALAELRNFITKTEPSDVIRILSNFRILWKLPLEQLQKHFNEKELEIIKLYREWRERFLQEEEFTEIMKLKTKLNKITDLNTLFSIIRKSIKLELPLACLGDIKYTFLIKKELEKINTYLTKLEKGEIKYETARKGINKYLNQICKKLEDITEILGR